MLRNERMLPYRGNNSNPNRLTEKNSSIDKHLGFFEVVWDQYLPVLNGIFLLATSFIKGG